MLDGANRQVPLAIDHPLDGHEKLLEKANMASIEGILIARFVRASSSRLITFSVGSPILSKIF
jgi:hypothetical protein